MIFKVCKNGIFRAVPINEVTATAAARIIMPVTALMMALRPCSSFSGLPSAVIQLMAPIKSWAIIKRAPIITMRRKTKPRMMVIGPAPAGRMGIFPSCGGRAGFWRRWAMMVIMV